MGGACNDRVRGGSPEGRNLLKASLGRISMKWVQLFYREMCAWKLRGTLVPKNPVFIA